LLAPFCRSKLVILKEPDDLLNYFDRSELESERLDKTIAYEAW